MKIGNIVRRLIFRYLSLEGYLKMLSRFYFISFNLGLLKGNRYYAYPYFLKHVVKEGDVCIDIGANLGYISVILSKLVGTTGKVHAVEPVKPVLSVLRSNTKHLKNLQIYPYALGTENKPIRLGNNTREKKGYVGSGSHFILDQHITESTNADIEFDAEMRIGSALFKDLDRVDFIKCDIEGYEVVVLPELEALISNFQPIILVETGGESRKKMLDFFERLQFKALVIREGKLYSTNEKETIDILFVPESKLPVVAQFIG